jgi:hypothetical protein
MSPWFAWIMTAATLRQTAAAEAIEKKPIHIMPSSSIAGSIEFHRVGRKSRWKAADNAAPVRGFLVELSRQGPEFRAVKDKFESLNVTYPGRT